MTTPQQREQEIRELLALWGGYAHDMSDFINEESIHYLLARVAQLEAALEEVMQDTTGNGGTRIWAKYILATMPEAE